MTQTKVCKVCGEEKTLDCFAKHKTCKHGVKTICKDCVNSEQSDRRKQLHAIKTATGCEICGYNESPYALQFDHIDPDNKTFNIGNYINAPHKLAEELKKCRVLCANCHMRHTFDPEFNGESDQKQLDLLDDLD